MSEHPYLSLVATSRNDDHGGNTLYRTQIFVDSFLELCAKHRLPAELILVEWNPPADRKPLAEVIRWDKQNEWVTCRVITVPWERHVMINYGRVLPLFQMIAKNVGIRRARGEFVLATNIDVILSDELTAFIAGRNLKKDRTYRCDRFDVDASIPDTLPLDERLRFAWGNLVRKNHRMHPREAAGFYEREAGNGEIADFLWGTGHFDVEETAGVEAVVAKDTVPSNWLHLDACGDFTMMHRDGWAKICGYPELEHFSLHIDSIGLNCAHWAGFRETLLMPPAVCFHIEHALGSGYVKENADPLYKRLERQGIPWLDHIVVAQLLDEMHERKEAIDFNTEAWGMRDIPLDETVCSADGLVRHEVPPEARAGAFAPVTAIRPQFHSSQYIEDRFRGQVEKERSFYRELKIGHEEAMDWIEKLKANIRELREANDALTTQNSAFAHQLDDLGRKIATVRERLGRYRSVFGWLERFGFFK